MPVTNKKTVWLELLFLLIASVMFFAPIFYVEIFSSKVGDYLDHINYAKLIYRNSQEIPKYILVHTGWQWIVKITHAILRNSWNSSAFIVTLGSNIFVITIIFLELRKNLSPLLSGALAIGLTLIGPIILLLPFDQKYVGYLWPNVYQNPTYLLLKPFAILQFLFIVGAIGKKDFKWIDIIFLAPVSAFAVYVKPNYAMCLLPAILIMTILNLINRQPVEWKKIVFSLGLPSIIILVLQYIVTYASNSDNSTISIMPFVVMKFHSNFLILKFVLSIIFPLIVTFSYWKEAIRDRRIQLGWLGFFVGSGFTYFFAEKGDRLFHANFLWNGEIAIFILFVGCVLFLSENKFFQKKIFVKWLILFLGFLHLYSGVFYYLSQMFYLLKS